MTKPQFTLTWAQALTPTHPTANSHSLTGSAEDIRWLAKLIDRPDCRIELIQNASTRKIVTLEDVRLRARFEMFRDRFKNYGLTPREVIRAAKEQAKAIPIAA